MRLPRRAVVALSVASLATALVGSAAAVTDPVNGPYPQVHGEMVTGLPSTPACTTTVVKDFRFHNTAYGSDAPFTGDYVPTCTGPWSKVVLTMSASVRTGTQFDRIGDVLIGGVELLHLTTAEGEAGETTWSVQRDVTAYSSLLAQRQPVYFIIGNQTDSTYTGDFYGTLSLTFYRGTATVPDRVLGLNPGVDRGLPTRSKDAPLVSSVTVPTNATALTAEVFASGHGAEEEDWWNAPFVCASGGIPYREVGISVDGRLAGTAPVYPTIFTGGYGPDFWRPIPSPRTFDLRPYTFDLTPFVGTLTDGQPHTLAIATIGQGGCDGYWFLGGNLLVTTNHRDAGRTLGGLVSYAGDPRPTSTSLGQQGTTASDRTTSSHHLAITGTVRPAGLPASTVTVVHDLANTAVDAALDVRSDWTWTSTTTTRTADGPASTSSQTSRYSLLRT
ncbi:MAG: peptide-N4-asparagine amidase, partial [Mycobacteriales bacterium]